MSRHEDLDRLPNGRITNDYLRKLCKSKGGYMTEKLNEKLYLQHKGVTKIENLDKFTGVKVLWLESNAVNKIEGLESLKELSCLYIHQNCIEHIEGIFHCQSLHTLNISENFISHIPEELGKCCTNLQTLDLNSNQLRTLDSIKALKYCTKLSILDLSKNKLFESIPENMTQEQLIEEFLATLRSLSELKLLRLEGNPLVRMIPNYRKEIIAQFPSLNYLDNMPIFEDERRTVNAWKRGGVEEEREERKKIAQEKKDKERKNFEAFEKLVENARREAQNNHKTDEKENDTNQDDEMVELKTPDAAALMTLKTNQDQEQPTKTEEIPVDDVARSDEESLFDIE
ncbi:hypothetical protein C9374_005720 [Naegleria lovaniensis]|uniref:Dynein assembly factor 1, axonemal homolog n=1 Tax=Naegleria lovaniensis TaxID=51637 RepID=A0AA88GPR8_NAELO|nr:uncharacterized protein C9374_005720 [Naegleria lovaniensis]KAG2381928.1 hypothetical protein C9374_005720 [Naegleria lovaniensis]